jgi:hypothetical protein
MQIDHRTYQPMADIVRKIQVTIRVDADTLGGIAIAPDVKIKEAAVAAIQKENNETTYEYNEI